MEDNKRAVFMHLDRDLINKFKAKCALSSTTMTKKIETLIQEVVDNG